jgi:hypothetical protein
MGQIQSGVISADDFSERITGVAVALLSAQLDNALTFKPVDKINPVDTHVLPAIPGNSLEEYVTYNSDTNRDHINKYILNHILDSEEHLNTFTSTLINRLSRPANTYLTAVTQPPKKSSAPAPAPSIKSASTIARPVASAPAPSVKSVAAPAPTSAPSVKSVAQAPLSEEHRSIKASQASRRSAQASQITEKIGSVKEVKEVTEVLTELENDVPSIRPVKGSNKLQKRMHTLDQAIDMERIAQERLREAQANINASYTDVVAPTQEEDVEVEFEHV